MIKVITFAVLSAWIVIQCSEAHADTISIEPPKAYENGTPLLVGDIDGFNVCVSKQDPNICDDEFNVAVQDGKATQERDGLLLMRYVRARTVMKTGVVSDWSKLAFIGAEPTQVYLKPSGPTVIIVE